MALTLQWEQENRGPKPRRSSAHGEVGRVAEVFSLEVSRAALLLQGCGGGWGKGAEEAIREAGDQVPGAPTPPAPLPTPSLPAVPPAPRSACARFRFRKVALVLCKGGRLTVRRETGERASPGLTGGWPAVPGQHSPPNTGPENRGLMSEWMKEGVRGACR